MKKSMKKVLALVLALATVLVCFSACGGKDKDSDGSTNEKTLKIGAIGPLTGDGAGYGTAVKNGAQLAVDEINAAGGINGIKIEFQMQDDENNAEKSVNAYNTLKDWGMQMLVGTVTTNPCLAVINNTKADNMFQLTPSASAVGVIANDNCFQVCFTDPNQGIASADYISENKVATKVAVIYDSSSAYSSGIYNTFKAEAQVKGLNIVSAEAFTSDSKSDFTSQLSKAKNAGAELVFLPIYKEEASSILSQANKMSYSPIFFGCDGLDGILNVDGFNGSLAEGTMLLTPFASNASDATTQKFVSAFKAKYNNDTSTLDQFAADGYDAIYIIKAAAEKAAITSDMSISAMCDALKKAMPEISVDGVTGSGMKWQATGEVNKSPKAVKISTGVYEAME